MNAPTIAYEEIGPREAAKFLASNENPRGKHPVGRIEAYARVMASKKWEPASIILLGFHDELLDGFGRLTAVIRTGIHQRFLVIRNFPPEYAHLIDGCKVRDPARTLAEVTSENIKSARALVSGIVRLPSRPITILTTDYVPLFELYRDGINPILAVTRGNNRGSIPMACKVAFAKAILNGLNPAKMQEGIRKLEQNDVSDAPSLRLLTLALRHDSKKGRGELSLLYIKTAKAIKAWVEGVNLKCLKADGDDPFPIDLPW